MKTINYIFFAITIFCLGSVIYLLTEKKSDKTAYFLSAEVYNEFDYKKELELELEQTQNEGQRIIDSLEMDLDISFELLKANDPTEQEVLIFERKKKNYMQRRDELENNYITRTQEYYDLIWERINTYVIEYGQENGYNYIFGANGDGSLMYADSTMNISTEIIEMINTRYGGE